MIQYKLIKISSKNTPQIADLIYKTYQKFNHNEGNDKSRQAFLRQYNPAHRKNAELLETFNKLNINIGAYSNEKLVGIIRGKNNRIINLFVDGNFHSQGIGKKLVSSFERQAKKEKSEFIKVRSSLYAINFYSRLGYKKTTGVRLYRGLKIQSFRKQM